MAGKVRVYTASYNFDFNGESYYDGYSIECSYVVHPGSAATWDDPGSSPQAEIQTVTLVQDAVKVDGRETQPRRKLDLPPWLSSVIEADEGLLESILQHDAEIEQADHDHDADMRADEARLTRSGFGQN